MFNKFVNYETHLRKVAPVRVINCNLDFRYRIKLLTLLQNGREISCVCSFLVKIYAFNQFYNFIYFVNSNFVDCVIVIDLNQ